MLSLLLPRALRLPGRRWYEHGETLLAAMVFALFSSAGHAAGTPAGTLISNTATLNYSIGGVPDSITSAPVSLRVDEIINLTLVWQNAGPVSVASPDTNDPLTFLLTNTGNGSEQFSLARNDALVGDNYDALIGSAGSIFLESGLAPGLQTSGPNADTAYVAGVNDPVLAADASRLIYVVSDTPAGLATGNTGLTALIASSMTTGAAGAALGTSLPGLGTGGVDAVVAASQGQISRIGNYIVSNVAVTVAKTVATVVDPRGGTNVEPGSVLTYRITITLTGAGVVNNLTVADPLPIETTYVPGGMRVNGVARTDAADGDNAEFSANTVIVNFGNAVSPAVHVIEFPVTVN